MSALAVPEDIVPIMRDYPAARGSRAAFRGVIESVEGAFAIVHVRRKIMADQTLHYMLRAHLGESTDLHEGDKIWLQGDIFGELEVHNDPGGLRYLLGINNVEVKVLEASALRNGRATSRYHQEQQ